MPDELPNPEYLLIREGCTFAFPEVSDEEIAALDFDQGPRYVHVAFQGRALVQFMRACMRLLREQLDEAEKNHPEQFARLKLVEKDLGQEWKDAGLP
jgi:hypothetical protein